MTGPDKEASDTPDVEQASDAEHEGDAAPAGLRCETGGRFRVTKMRRVAPVPQREGESI